jgi:outer membrane autotransporter protein
MNSAAANGETLDTDLDYGETWVEVGLGGTCRFNTSTMAYADIERSYSSNLTEKWQINAGITWQF